ncbi:MAG: hypothetical protein KJ767_02450 [Nanoarchaeota archaeon]|nr:hypothetical protein [Nanoarchaeota archaeon]
MIFLAHALLGTLIGYSLSNLFLIAIIAFLSHFLLDALPHIDTGSFKRKSQYTRKDWYIVMFDIIIGLAFVIYFALKLGFLPVFIGAFFAILPDAIDGSAWLFKFKKMAFFKKMNAFHENFGFKMKHEFILLGYIIEVAVILGLLSILFWL